MRRPGAAIEGSVPDDNGPGRQRDLAQGRAFGEGGPSDLGEVGWQRDLAQGRALVEGVLSNLGEVGRKRDLAQGRALAEGAPSNLGESGRQRDLAQRRALQEGALSNLGLGFEDSAAAAVGMDDITLHLAAGVEVVAGDKGGERFISSSPAGIAAQCRPRRRHLQV